MPHGLKGERTLMRIHIGERDRYHGKPLYQAIVELLRERHHAGATVLRAIMGFGATAKLHTDRIEVRAASSRSSGRGSSCTGPSVLPTSEAPTTASTPAPARSRTEIKLARPSRSGPPPK